jgi:hypothetical protein
VDVANGVERELSVYLSYLGAVESIVTKQKVWIVDITLTGYDPAECSEENREKE